MPFRAGRSAKSKSFFVFEGLGRMKPRGDRRRFACALESLEDRVVMTVYPTTTTLSESLSSALVGTSVSFTATVTSTGSPTGNVAFLDGSTVLATLPLASGTAIYTTSSLLLGQHQIQAVYLGSGTYTESASAGVWGNNAILSDVGNGTQGYSGDGGYRYAAELDNPSGMAFDKYGNMFIVDPGNNVVREVSINAIISTYAGNGTAGYSGNGGQAASAMLDQPSAIAMDAAGDLFIADAGNHVVREVTPSGIISTYAGNGTAGYSGDGGQASAAEMITPSGFAFDAAGDLFIADSGGNVVREVTPSGVISTFAGTGTSGYTGDGGQASSARLSGPSGLAFDALGNLFIADSNNNVIREITPAGQINTVVGNGTAGYTGDAGQAASAELQDPTSIAFDSRGDLFIADTANNVVREVVASGVISTLAGTGTAGYSGNNSNANAAELHGPQGVAFDSSGQLFIADSLNHVVRQINPLATTLYVVTGYATTTTLSESLTSNLYGMTIRFTATVASGNGVPTGSVSFMSGSSVFGTANLVNGVAVLSTSTIAAGSYQVTAVYNGSGAFYTSESAATSPSSVISAAAGNGTYGYTGDGGQATAAELRGPRGLGFDAAGNMYVADTNNNVVRKVTPAGVISTVAGNGTAGYSGDGGPATSAELWQPDAVAVNAAGDLFIADLDNDVIREVTPAGIINTIAGTGTPGYSGDGGLATSAAIGHPVSLAFDSAGDLLFGDVSNNVIREINTAGIISTVVGDGSRGYGGDGGPATSAELNEPTGIAFNTAGDLFIADSGNNVIREVTPSGIISTFAGTSVAGYTGDGGPATSAELNYPNYLAFDAHGDLFISDTNNNVVREVSASGIMSTIVGIGTSGGSGNSGPSGAAQLNTPQGLAFDSAGNLFVADQNNNEIRVLTAPLASALPLTVIASPTTTTLSVAAGPSSTTLEAMVSSSSATVDVGTVAFYDGSRLLGVSQVMNGEAVLQAAALSTGQHTLIAVFSGDENLISSSAQQSVTVAPSTAGPTTVVGLSRYGVGNQPTLVSLFFNQTLNPAEALWKHNYQLHDRHGDRIGISHIYFDPTTSTVTLLPVHKLSLRSSYTLKVLGLNPKKGSKGATPTVTSSGWLENNFRAQVSSSALSAPGAPPAVTFVNGREASTRG